MWICSSVICGCNHVSVIARTSGSLHVTTCFSSSRLGKTLLMFRWIIVRWDKPELRLWLCDLNACLSIEALAVRDSPMSGIVNSIQSIEGKSSPLHTLHSHSHFRRFLYSFRVVSLQSKCVQRWQRKHSIARFLDVTVFTQETQMEKEACRTNSLGHCYSSEDSSQSPCFVLHLIRT